MHDLHVLIDRLILLAHPERGIMASLEELQAAVDRATAEVARLVAAVEAAVPPDFQPQVDALNAASDAADAAVPPAPAEPPA